MNDRVDHRIHRDVVGGCERRETFGVPKQHVQKLVAHNGLDVRFRAALRVDERQIHEEARPRLAGDGKRRYGVGELDRQDLQHRADGKRVLLDQFPVDIVKMCRIHT